MSRWMLLFLECEPFFFEHGGNSSIQGELLGEEQNAKSQKNWPGFENNDLALSTTNNLIKEHKKVRVGTQEDVPEQSEHVQAITRVAQEHMQEQV